MIVERARLKQRIRKDMKDAGEDFDVLVAELKAENNPTLTYKVPAEYAEQFKKFVADNKDRRQTTYPWPDVVAYGLSLNPDKSLRDADRERMTQHEFMMPSQRYARDLLHQSTGWFPLK
jgi:hypothetical protein